MQERLRYDIDDEHRLILDVPTTIFDAAVAESRIAEILERPEELVTYEETSGGGRLAFSTAAFDRIPKRDGGVSEAYASQWFHTLVAIERHTLEQQRDPRVHVAMSAKPLDDRSGQGRYGMRATLQWPLDNDLQASRDATAYMQGVALKFGYLTSRIAEAAYAHVSRSQGAELQALDMGCCCLGTDGMEYDPRATAIELYGHNLYNRQVILTCLSGLVIIARHSE